MIEFVAIVISVVIINTYSMTVTVSLFIKLMTIWATVFHPFCIVSSFSESAQRQKPVPRKYPVP
jgi:hypothetical protein